LAMIGRSYGDLMVHVERYRRHEGTKSRKKR
jgi:hypothetical protein